MRGMMMLRPRWMWGVGLRGGRGERMFGFGELFIMHGDGVGFRSGFERTGLGMAGHTEGVLGGQ
jgi:hypothetical protein